MEDRSATDLFAHYLDAKERGENPDFDALCAAHPEHASTLRERHAEQQRMEAALAQGRTIHSTANGDPSRWREYVEKLGKLGPPAARYVRGAELNSGGMGAIHRVADPLLERRLVVKLMHGDAGADPTRGPTPRSDDRSLGRFLEEAKITARLDHPYIVPVHDIGLDEAGRVYFAMKHVRGEDLRAIFDRIHDGDPDWSMTKGVQVMLKVCEAMAYAHVKGVIHRDLKPGNVMVGKFGEVYVMDWGLARILGEDETKDLRIREDTSASVMQSERRAKHAASGATPDSPLITMDGDVMGTPAYMPLEQAEGNLAAIGPLADIYAVGAMLYHLLAGTMPYVEKGETVTQRVIWQRVKSRPPRPLHELAPDAPAELVAIVDKAMARDARDRYPDMKALAADLQAYLDVKVVSAYETGAIAELKKWVQRNPALAAAAGLLVAVLAGATAIVLKKNQDLDQKNTEITTQKATVEARKAEFDQLAGKVYLERAIEREKDLYPPWPEKIEAMETWLAEDAQRLLDLKPTIESTLADLRARALPSTDETHASPSDSESKAGRVLTFALEAETFLYTTLSELAVSIASFESGAKSDVEQRLAWAKQIGDLTLRHPNARVTWDEARAAIRKADDVVASKLYAQSPDAPIDLKPQMGVVPIGMNPVTKLWEFYELRSACDVLAGQDPATIEIPSHRDDGSIEVQDGTGIVFVLLPGGTFLQGAQTTDENAPNYDPRAESDERPQEVTPSPFFLARHELTRAQWYRLSNGEEPSTNKRDTQFPDDPIIGWTHPVEGVDWWRCDALLRSFGLKLPTEAQSEFGARGGTTTPWWTGRDASSLLGVANVLDLRAEAKYPGWGRQLGDFDDGFIGACAVGSAKANSFGLFDVHGNVWEWCLDAYVNRYGETRLGDGLRAADAENPSDRVLRGGSFNLPASLARSANRDRDASTIRGDDLGARPSRSLDLSP